MWQAVKKLSIILDRNQKKNAIILFVLMIIGGFFEMLSVSLMLPLMTAIMKADILENRYVAMICAPFGVKTAQGFIILCIIAIIIINIVKGTFLLFKNYLQARYINNNKLATQRKLLSIVLNRPYEYFLNTGSGTILRMINEDVSLTYNILQIVLQAMSELVISITLVILVFVIDPLMTGMIGAIMMIMAIVIIKCVKPIMRDMGEKKQKAVVSYNKWLLQSISGIKEIKVTKREEYFRTKFGIYGKKLIDATIKNTVLSDMPKNIIEMTSVSAVLAVIAIITYMGRPMDSLVISMGAFVMAAIKLLPSANRIVVATNNIAFQMPGLDRMLENMADIYDEKITDRKNTTEETKREIIFEKDIVFNNVSFSYFNSEEKIFDKAFMKIPIGKSVGIVGTSGAGKTTAVDILLGLLNPQEGQVICNGVDVSLNLEQWLGNIGYIPQAIFMLDESIKKNIAFGLDDEDINEERVWDSLRDAQLDDYVNHMPRKLESQIGERGLRISGGQRQRIGIARALYPNPQILVFDEATSALDNETEAGIMRSIHRLQGDKTMIIIAHRLQTIEKCDIVYRVEDGKITVERGSEYL